MRKIVTTTTAIEDKFDADADADAGADADADADVCHALVVVHLEIGIV